MASRPPIPNSIKRAVRQRSGFGCVICGKPLYEYDHLLPYSKVEEHAPHNIVLLCAQHHAEKTKGLLPLEAVEEASRNPRNLDTEESSPYQLHYGGIGCESVIGSNRHLWPTLGNGDFTVPLLIDDTPLVLFRVEDEHLLLTVQLFDRNNNLVVRILDNELLYSIDPWDIEFVGSRITVRNGPGDIFVGMDFDPPSSVTIDQGRVWRNGYEVRFADHQLVVPGENVLTHCEMTQWVVGVAIGSLPNGCGPVGVHIADQPRESYIERQDETITRLRACN